MFGEKAERRNAMHETTLPVMVTALQPYLLVRADTSGPENNQIRSSGNTLTVWFNTTNYDNLFTSSGHQTVNMFK